MIDITTKSWIKMVHSVIVESWEEANIMWWHKKMFLSHIEVWERPELDQKQVRGDEK